MAKVWLSVLTLFFVGGVRAETAPPPAAGASGDKTKKNESAQAKLDAVQTRHDLIESEINTLNKKNKCDGDGECEVIEAGSRLCGGPSAYFVVSINNPQYARIKAKANELTAVEKELNSLQTMGDCSTAPKEPVGKCVENACTAGKR